MPVKISVFRIRIRFILVLLWIRIQPKPESGSILFFPLLEICLKIVLQLLNWQKMVDWKTHYRSCMLVVAN